MENSSKRYSYDKVKYMVERQKERYGWEFLFLGANIDAAAEAARFGINENRAVNYHADCAGTAVNYRALSIVSVESNFTSTFQSVGINQTLHSIYVSVICNINVHFPLYVKNQSTLTKILISEAVLVGKVPDVYLNGGLFS
jgi:hypothetical protein